MTVVEKAVRFMEETAANDEHGYDQESRWGTPDYDCSSLVISAYKHAGLALASTYTGNMKADFLAHGFSDVTRKVNLATGQGMKRGDVLLHERNHTAMYVGAGMIVHASGNEFGKATGGQPGDQTGREICKTYYFNYGSSGWDCVLRYEGKDAAPAPENDKKDESQTADAPYEDAKEGEDFYIVKQYDTLWGIADRFLGDGSLFPLLQQLNGLKGTNIVPGMMLLLHPEGLEPETKPTEEPKPPEEHIGGAGAYQIALQVLRRGDSGREVQQAQRLIIATGYKMPKYGADGDYGEETEAAVKKFQADNGLEQNGTVDKATMSKLLGL